MESISLSRLNEYIRRAIVVNFNEPIWIICELVSIKINKGHYYLDLAERQGEEILAQSSAVIWKTNANAIANTSNIDLDSILKEGNEIRIAVQVDYHIRYGLKLNIEKIDAAFSLGKIAQKRAAIIQQLIDEKIFQKNLETSLPSVIRNIAVITSSTAAGKQDFDDQLLQNNYDYTFNIEYFHCAMQGMNTESEISTALQTIIKSSIKYDCIAIVRGGGSKLDLLDFDSYIIAKWISLSPIPVLTGIGHKIDESIADLSAYENLKTPTAVAEYIIQHNMEFENTVLSLYEQIIKVSGLLLQKQRTLLDHFHHNLKQLALSQSKKYETILEKNKHLIQFHSYKLIQQYYQKIELEKNKIENNNPLGILDKGYVMVSRENQRITSSIETRQGDMLKLHFKDGEIEVIKQ